MKDINVPSYNSLLPGDRRIRAIQDLYDYISRWKPEIDAMEATVPSDASPTNQLATESSVATNSATFQGNYNLVLDLSLTTSATESDIATALASAISDAENNDYCYVQIPIADDAPTQIDHEDRYKFNGTSWVYEFSPNASPIDGVFDVSAYNNNTKYSDLSVALADIPDSVKKGGMSIKYVQSSDNKYHQFRLLTQQFSTTVTDWEEEGSEPVANLFIDKKGLSIFARPYIFITQDDIEQGGFLYTKKVDNAKRIRCKFAIPVTSGTILHYNLNGKAGNIIEVDALDSTTWTNTPIAGDGETVFNHDCFVLLLFRYSNDSNISPSDYNCQIKITNYSLNGIVEEVNNELVLKWISSALSWTNAQKKQGRSNLGFGNGDIDNEPIADSDNLVKSGGVELQTRKSNLFIDKKVMSLFVKSNIEISQSDIEQGGFVHTKKNDASNRIRCKFAIPVTNGTVVSYDMNGKEGTILKVDALNSTSSSGTNLSSHGQVTYDSDGFILIVIRNSDNANISPSDYNCQISIKNVALDKLFNEVNTIDNRLDQIDGNTLINTKFEIGAYAGIAPTYNSKRARLPLTPITDRVYISGVDMTKYRMQIIISNNGTYESSLTYGQSTDDNADTISYVLPSQYIGSSNLKFGIQLVNKTDDDISAAELARINANVKISYKMPKVKGKHIMRYKFGGDGNDWCFVRTPDNYDAYSYKKFPFVICNHGNGWVMDGNPYRMNWTNITMYASASYIASQTADIRGRFIETSDFSLWWSNPTIEALLAAGFVVCGCENYGDGLYGNENCRKACEAFYEHIISNFNVEKRCCMIGASNGAQTSINAAYLLGTKVKAMILQFPLTCLVNQYFNNNNQQAGIRAAYGITNTSIDESGLISATRTHDVLHTDVIDGKKLGYFPPCKLYYSLSDDVVDATENALSLFTCLDNSFKIVEKKECTGGHGDASHFSPSEYVAFLSSY